MTATCNDAIHNFSPPNLQRISWLRKLYHAYFRPTFLHTERLQLRERPALLVGNHTITGILDTPFLVEHCLLNEGVMLRSLGDKVHFHVPLWGRMLQSGGMVLASRENAAALMQRGDSMMLFPGGAREVMRRKGEKYQLLWKQRTGFVEIAMQHGYDIIPFASLGPDDCYDIHLDANQYARWPIIRWLLNRPWLKKLTRNGDILPSLFTGILFTPIPKPQKFYFSFGERISTAELQANPEQILQLRDATAQSIQQQLEQLKQQRVQDVPRWSRLRRCLCQASINQP